MHPNPDRFTGDVTDWSPDRVEEELMAQVKQAHDFAALEALAQERHIAPTDPVEVLVLSEATLEPIYDAKIYTLRDLTNCTKEYLLSIPGFDAFKVDEVISALASYDLTLRRS